MSRLKGFAPLLGLLFGSILFGMGLINLRGTLASASWVPVSAVITHSAVESSGGRDRTTAPVIEYNYRHGESTYTGTRIRYGLFTSPSSARTLVDRYVVGDSATVYIDEGDPARSVMQHSPLSIPIAQTAIGAVLLGIWLAAARREKA